MVPLSSLSAGFSKVSLSLLVMPWKALPMALVVAPVVWILPAMYRMIFQNSMRHTTASAFTGLTYLVLMFAPVPCMENLFSDLSFYLVALVSSFFAYTFFPEVLLHDMMFMHYLAASSHAHALNSGLLPLVTPWSGHRCPSPSTVCDC